MIHIKIIRHAQRLDFAQPQKWLFYIGYHWSDTPLTPYGFTSAESKSKELAVNGFKPKYIYTSPYIRTMQTAAVFKNTFATSEIIVEPLLAEMQPTNSHTITIYPNGIPTTYNGIDTNFTYPETNEQFDSRVQFIISQLINRNKCDLIIITHGEVLKRYINFLQTLFPEQILDAGSTPYLTTIAFDYDCDADTIVKNSIRIE